MSCCCPECCSGAPGPARDVDAYLATAAVRACPGDAGADSEVALGSMATQEWVVMQHETAYEQNRRSPTGNPDFRP